MSASGESKGTKAKEPEKPEKPIMVGEINKELKYKSIELFTGDRNKLQGFILQLRLYEKFNREQFRSQTERVLWAVTLLEGKAMNWIEGFLEDYLTKTDKAGTLFDNMQKTTLTIFRS